MTDPIPRAGDGRAWNTGDLVRCSYMIRTDFRMTQPYPLCIILDAIYISGDASIFFVWIPQRGTEWALGMSIHPPEEG